MLPLISFIIPVYNCEKWVKKCIQSIFNVNIENYEIIIVDDFSTDNGLQILEEYRHIDNIYIYINVKKGVSSARNLGITKARGKYLCFVDADDCLCGNWAILSELKREDSNLILSPIYDKKIYDEYSSIQKFLINIDSYDLVFRMGTLWGKLYLRKLILDKKIFFDEELSIGEDTDFNIKYFYYVSKIKFFDEKVYIHQNVNDFSLSKISNLGKSQKKKILDKVRKLFKFHNVTCEKYIEKKGVKYFGTAN